MAGLRLILRMRERANESERGYLEGVGEGII
jgi:hypothetical protein